MDNNLANTSTDAQRSRLLARLQVAPIDTFCAMRELNICRPSARISELRAAGHAIRTQRISLTDDQGRTHHGIAMYVLTTCAEPAQAEA